MTPATTAWKQRKCEEESSLLLKAATALDPSIANQFPRPLEDILAACLPSLRIHRCRNLSQVEVRRLLLEEHGVTYIEDGTEDLAGFTFAAGELVVMFLETRHGKEFELFTLAHEAGHIATEYLPQLASRDQLGLFGNSETPVRYFHRDPAANLLAGRTGGAKASAPIEVELAKLRSRGDEFWLREVKANGCAAELLAPSFAVREVLRASAVGNDGERINILRRHFGLSRSAADVRLRELGLTTSNTTLELFT